MQSDNIDNSVAQPGSHAALFVDFNKMLNRRQERSSSVLSDCDIQCNLLLTVLKYLEREKRISAVIRNCYADFELLAGQPVLQSLHLMGFETRHYTRVSGMDAHNILMVLDALETLYTRKNIDVFVLAVSDRCYIDLIRTIQKNGKRVLILADPSNLSGDVLYNVNQENIIDMRKMNRFIPNTKTM